MTSPRLPLAVLKNNPEQGFPTFKLLETQERDEGLSAVAGNLKHFGQQKFLGIKSHFLNCEQIIIKKKATGVNFSGYTEDMQMAVNTSFFKTLVVTSFSSQLL